MHREILQILRCPKCNEELALITEKEEDSEIIEGKLKCKNNHCWQISEGVINFQSVEQEQIKLLYEIYRSRCSYLFTKWKCYNLYGRLFS